MSDFIEFDDFAEEYNANLKLSIRKFSEFERDYFAQYKVQIVAENVQKKEMNILDFGCGDGICCEFFAKYFPEALITGLDVSSKSIEIAQSRNLEKAVFLSCESGKSLPFKTQSFDVIFAACVFHHIEEKEHKFLLKEFERVLKRGGKVFVFEHNPYNPFTRKAVKDCVFDKDAKLIKASDFKKEFESSGFEKVEKNYTLFFPRYKVFKKLFSLEKYLKKAAIGAQYYIEAAKSD